MAVCDTSDIGISAKINNVSQRVAWLDVMKGMGIFFVIVGHVAKIAWLTRWLFSFHMPLFFFAAGYVYHKKAIGKDIIRRIQTIVIPYFAFGIIELIYWALVERRFRESSVSFKEAIIGLLLGKESSLDFNVHFWFLPCFFLTVILFNAGMNIIRNPILLYWVIILSSICFAIWGTDFPDLPWGLNRIPKYMLFFLVGYRLKNIDIINKFSGNRWVLLGIVAVIIEAILANYYGIIGFVWYVDALIGVFGFLLICINQKNELLQYIGRSSLVIMCFHGPVYRILIKVFSLATHISADRYRDNIFLVLFVSIFTIPICLFLNQIIIRHAPWVIGKNISERVLKRNDS